MRKKWYAAIAATIGMLVLLTGCGDKKLEKPELHVSENFFQYRGKTMAEVGGGNYVEDGFLVVPIEDGRGLLAFSGDAEQVDQPSFHVQGLLGALLDDLPKDLTLEQLAEKMSWKGGQKLEAVQVENAETPDHVGENYVEIRLDSDGDDILDAALEISMDHYDTLNRKCKCRLVWIETE